MLLKIGLIAALLTTPSETPVADAAEHNNVQSVRYLLQHGEDVNAAQSDGLTALHWAALNNNLEVTEILLYAGGSVKSTTRVGGYTPLHLAAIHGHEKTALCLIENGANVIIGVSELGRICLNITRQFDDPKDTAADT